MVVVLREQGLSVLKPRGNFILIRVPDKESVVGAFKDWGILVNGLGMYQMPEFIRVSAGAPDEVTAFLDAAAEILSPH